MGEGIADPYLRQSVFVNLETSFQRGIVAATPWADKVAVKVPSTSRATRHAWLTQVGKFKQYVGEKQVEKLALRDYIITNLKYELTIEIPEEDFEDDQVGLFGKTAEMMGQQAAKWPDDMLTNVIQNGKTLLCYDGQPFFNASHPISVDKPAGGTFSNLYTAMPLTPDNFSTALQLMQSFKSENGRNVPVVPMLTVVDPTNTINLKKILNSGIIATSVAAGSGVGGATAITNVLQGATGELTIPEFGNQPGVWYLLGTLGGMSPFLYQVRKEPKTTPLTADSASNVFWHDKFVWGSKARGAAGYTFPILAMRFEPT